MALLLVRCSRCGHVIQIPEEEMEGIPKGAAFICLDCKKAEAGHRVVNTRYTITVSVIRDGEWVPFGTHAVDGAKVDLEFSTDVGEDGLPLLERERTVLAATSFSAEAPTLKAAFPLLGKGLSDRWARLESHAGLADVEVVGVDSSGELDPNVIKE